MHLKIAIKNNIGHRRFGDHGFNQFRVNTRVLKINMVSHANKPQNKAVKKKEFYCFVKNSMSPALFSCIKYKKIQDRQIKKES